MSRRALLFPATVFAIGFTAAGAQPAGSVVRDSAGVRIVVSRPAELTRVAFTVPARARMSIGGLRSDADEELNARHPFLAPLRLSDRRIVVADWSSIKFYGPSGEFQKSVGRRGNGPGEFGQLRRVCRLQGDTLLAMGYSDRRLSLWSPSGKFIRALAPLGLGATEPCFDDGTLLMIRTARPATGRAVAGFAPHVRLTTRDSIVYAVGDLPVETYDLPVARRVSVVVHRDLIVAADATTYEIRTYSGTGALIQILRVNARPKRIPDAIWNEWLANSPPTVRARAAALQRRPSYPAFAEVRVDPADRIWVHDYHDPRRWEVFSAGGTALGSVIMPEIKGRAADLVAFDGNEVVLRHSDTDGAAILSWYSLRSAGHVP